MSRFQDRILEKKKEKENCWKVWGSDVSTEAEIITSNFALHNHETGRQDGENEYSLKGPILLSILIWIILNWNELKDLVWLILNDFAMTPIAPTSHVAAVCVAGPWGQIE